MLTIQLVLVNGRLVGRTFSDRYNLKQLGIDFVPYSRNQIHLKRLRRYFTDFNFVHVQGEMARANEMERLAFSPTRKAA